MRSLKKYVSIGKAVGILFISIFSVQFFLNREIYHSIEQGYTSLISSPYHGLAAFCDVASSDISFKQQDVCEIDKKEEYIAHVAVAKARENRELLQFNQTLARFKKGTGYSEFALQQVIDLLSYEIRLVQLLFNGYTGALVEETLDRRITALKYSTPSVAFMYNTILDLATYDYQINNNLLDKVRKHTNKKLASLFDQRDKKIFLSAMENKLKQYQDILRKMQYSMAVESQMAIENVTIDGINNTIYFCPAMMAE